MVEILIHFFAQLLHSPLHCQLCTAPAIWGVYRGGVTLSVPVVTMAMPLVTVLEKGQCNSSVQMTEHRTGYLAAMTVGVGISPG